MYLLIHGMERLYMGDIYFDVFILHKQVMRMMRIDIWLPVCLLHFPYHWKKNNTTLKWCLCISVHTPECVCLFVCVYKCVFFCNVMSEGALSYSLFQSAPAPEIPAWPQPVHSSEKASGMDIFIWKWNARGFTITKETRNVTVKGNQALK